MHWQRRCKPKRFSVGLSRARRTLRKAQTPDALANLTITLPIRGRGPISAETASQKFWDCSQRNYVHLLSSNVTIGGYWLPVSFPLASYSSAAESPKKRVALKNPPNLWYFSHGPCFLQCYDQLPDFWVPKRCLHWNLHDDANCKQKESCCYGRFFTLPEKQW